MTMQQKIATVFGGTGFLGRQIVRGLANRGYTVKIASRAPESAFFLRTAGVVGQIVPFACDYKNPASIGEAVRGSEIVVNCIGILFERKKGDFKRVHVELAGGIAAACAFENVKRLIHISAVGVERSTSEYAKTKFEGEKAVAGAFPFATILRPNIIFGVDDSFFNKFAQMLPLLPVVPLIGGGHTKFQPVYVGDVADAVVIAALAPAAAGQVFELAGPDTVSFKEIYEILFRYTGRRKPFMSLPWGVAKAQACVMSIMPTPILTCDQVESLKTDYVAAQGGLGLADLGISATGMDLILPTYLESYRPGGKFADRKAA